MTSILGPEWHISPDGVGKIIENGDIKDKQKIYNAALNIDLKEICSPVLSNELSKDKTSTIILQIQKIRNISAPKANEESQAAPRMLKLSLTDGDSYVQALEINVINSISRNKTPPGTKVLVSNAKITSGYLLLTPNNCTVLGGKVPHLVEKWEVAKSVQRNHRVNYSDDGPPPWVNFGTKIQNNIQEFNFKSLGKNKDSTKENSEFELQRQGAIAEATSGATKKVFSGRVRTNIQPAKTTENFRDKREQTRSKSKFVQKEEFAEKPLKPVEKLSLFSFLEDKLPVNGAQNSAKNFVPPESFNAHIQKEYQPYPQQNKEFNTSRDRSLNQSTLKQFEKPYIKNSVSQRETQKSNENHNVFSQHNVEAGKSHEKSFYQNTAKQFEKPSNKNQKYQKETQKSNENHNVYPTSQAKSIDSRFSHTTQNDFNIPERLQKKQTDKPKFHATQNNFDNNRHHLSDRSQVQPINQSQYSQKKSTNDFLYNTNQSNYSNQYETSDRLHHKPRDYRDFNQSQNNNYQCDASKRSQQKQNDNSNSTSQSNYTNRYEPRDHKAKERIELKTNQINYDKYSNTSYVKPQEKPVQKVDEITTSETGISSKNGINDVVNSTEKLSLNSQFASRSLRQHLNLGPPKKSETSGNGEEVDTRWSVGDECLARYWEDGKFYNATITAITEKTFAVRFKGYGNIEEILKSDCLPIVHSNKQDYNHQNRRYDQNTRPHSGSMEFRRSTRNYK